MGGGGANLLDSPETGNNSGFEGVDEDPKKEGVTTWTTPTYKTYQEYFTDNNYTKESLTEDDLSGKGTREEPYVLSSTKGFMLFFNYSLCNIDYTNKYVELACDVVLNDEKFDKDGNPSGGDGVIYAWYSLKANGLIFNGNGHTISGLYQNNETETDKAGMFIAVQSGSYLSNFKLVNLYINSYVDKTQGYNGYVGALTRYLGGSTIENCYIEGAVKGGAVGGIAGYSSTTSTKILNCSTNLNIFATHGGGLVSISWGADCYNCTTNGEINGSYVGGIICDMQFGGRIEKCISVANLKSKGATGGMIARSFHNSTALRLYRYEVIDCEVRGSISSSGYCVGGLSAFMSQSFYVENFKLTTNVSGYSSSLLFGVVYDNTFAIIKNVTIKFDAQNGHVPPICYYSSASNKFLENAQMIFDGMSVDIKNINFANRLTILMVTHYGCDFSLSNAEINMKGNLYPIFFYGQNNSATEMRKLKNVICNFDSNGDASASSYVKYDSIGMLMEGVLINYKNAKKEQKFYYGDDFSAFFVDWKNGKIGLKSNTANGFFQKTLTEDILTNKGYIKTFV